MRLHICEDEAEVAAVAAEAIATGLREAIAARSSATLALSGGSTPEATFVQLSEQDLDWTRVHVVQVDERVAGEFDGARNLAMQRDALIGRVEVASLTPMPVGDANLARAAYDYNEELAELSGEPVQLDVVQLGLGADGHTASLIPGDAALEVDDRDVTISAPYQGRVRMTLTVAALRNAHRRVWVVTGHSKQAALAGVVARDPALPASAVIGDDDLVVVDRAAAGQAPTGPDVTEETSTDTAGPPATS